MTTNAARTRGKLTPDLIAGVTTDVANIPDAMATAILAGANPVQGLYAIMIGTPLGAIFDRTGTTDEILGAENVFETTTILGAGSRAAYAAAQLWLLQATTDEIDQ